MAKHKIQKQNNTPLDIASDTIVLANVAEAHANSNMPAMSAVMSHTLSSDVPRINLSQKIQTNNEIKLSSDAPLLHLPKKVQVKKLVEDFSKPQHSAYSSKIPGHKFVVPTPINPDKLDLYLNGYDPKIRSYLVNGFRHGFRLMNDKYTTSDSDKVLKSAVEHPEIVDS